MSAAPRKAGAKPASARQLRAALEKFLDRATPEEKQLDIGSSLIHAIVRRAPVPTPAPKPPHPRELPPTVDQRDRACSYIQQAGYLVSAIRTLAVQDKGPLYNDAEAWWAFETAVEQLPIRVQVLLDAALCALNDDVSMRSPEQEDIRERKMAERRRAGKPETEPGAAAETA